MRISPLHSVIFFSSAMHQNASSANHISSDHSLNQTIQGVVSSFFEMWLPMFIAMAIKIPGISSLTKFIRIPMEIVLKALIGLGLSEAVKFVTGRNLIHNH